eukprot:scaffold6781_cov107-Isochrysis_galbana.AAC.10
MGFERVRSATTKAQQPKHLCYSVGCCCCAVRLCCRLKWQWPRPLRHDERRGRALPAAKAVLALRASHQKKNRRAGAAWAAARRALPHLIRKSRRGADGRQHVVRDIIVSGVAIAPRLRAQPVLNHGLALLLQHPGALLRLVLKNLVRPARRRGARGRLAPGRAGGRRRGRPRPHVAASVPRTHLRRPVLLIVRIGTPGHMGHGRARGQLRKSLAVIGAYGERHAARHVDTN